MFKLLVLSALVAVAFGASAKLRPRVPMLDGRIVGGENAQIVDYPYQISLQYYGSHICGGSIIGNNIVLTAAHCTDGIQYGTTYVGEGGQVINVASINQHSDFDAVSFDFDVTVLHLAQSITFSAHAQPVDLVASGTEEGGRTAVVSGWGALFAGGWSPSQLQVVTVSEVNRDDCQSAYNRITDRMICFADEGKDSCQGDSGGPLVADGVQVGVVSWGYGCADPNYPGVYSNVAVLRSFIDSA